MTAVSELELLFPGDGEMARLMRAADWSQTALGPIERWPNALRAAVRIVLTSRFSMWMGWGDDLTFFYNDSYRRDTLAQKHPRALGLPTREVWSEIWADVSPRIDEVVANGRATWDEGLLLMLERGGYREETYHTFSYSPLHDDGGRVRGVLCVVVEETGRVISERRVALLGKVAAQLAGTNTDEGALASLRRSLATDARDLPFTLTYLSSDDGAIATRAGHSGFADDDAVPDVAWPMREVLATGRPVEVALDTLEGLTLDAVAWPRGPWPTAPTRALLLPIARPGQAAPAGVLVAGVNPHRELDGPYREFLDLFVGQVGAGLASVRAYERERERQRAESLAQLDRAKTAFFANVSHEFRTPLTLMLGPLEDALGDPELGARQRDDLATVHRNALRLLKLVNTMLDFSRIEAGAATAQVRPVDLAQLTGDLASVFRAATEQAGLRFVVDTPPLDAPVAVDREMWEKIVLNLISNAFKFTFVGEIVVGLARRGGHVELTVRDTGTGIPATELGHVFDRFHRVEGSKGRTHEGTGIGLALVHELVRLHHGTVAVVSELGLGTTFTVAIPMGPPGPRAVAHVDGPSDPSRKPNPFALEAMRWLPHAPEPAPSPLPRGQRPYILVADDNADMRDYLQRMLGARWEVDAVANGREALIAIGRRRSDLVISDVMMPELDGFGLLAALRADPSLRELPVIVVSARAGDEARGAGLEAGASDYLVKPFVARELLAQVESQLLRAAMVAAGHGQARRFAAIFEQAPVAIAIMRGPEHVFELANPPYRRLIGGRDVVGRTVAAGLPEVVAQGFVTILDEVYRTGVPYLARSMLVELEHPETATRQPFFLDFVYEPMRDVDGTIDGVAAVVHDVTALAQARRDAELANQAKDGFLALLGHELRNPLAPITSALQLIRQRGIDGAEREYAVIERQVNHLVGLVDDLLDVSRITRGKVDLRLEPVELSVVIERAVESVGPLLEARGHQLALDVAPALYVEGDQARLAQVVANLLTNAAKYTPSGGRVEIAARRVGDAVELRIADDGIGIDPAILPNVFEPFVQSKQALDRAHGGLGLGLAIVDNLTKLHGGTVVAESAGTGLGCTVTVRLPATEAPAPAPAAAPIPAPTAAPPAALAKTTILVVDDNVDAAELLSEILADAGYETRAAHDGPSALAIAASFQPVLAILDLGLPVMTGFELARLLRAQPATAATQLIALTGYGQPQDREATAVAGFAAHLVKPVDLATLYAVIKSLLAR